MDVYHPTLLPRYYSGYGNRGCFGNSCRSNWHRWGRWILAGILIFIGAVILLGLLCIQQRRRRRANPRISTPMQSQPMQQPHIGGYGGGVQSPQGYGQGYEQQYAPPPTAPPQYGGHEGANADYYGQTSGVAPPQNAYQPPYNK